MQLRKDLLTAVNFQIKNMQSEIKSRGIKLTANDLRYISNHLAIINNFKF